MQEARTHRHTAERLLNVAPSKLSGELATASKVLDHPLAASTIRFARVRRAARWVTEFYDLPWDDIACDMRDPRKHGGLQPVQAASAMARQVDVGKRALSAVLIRVISPWRLNVSRPIQEVIPVARGSSQQRLGEVYAVRLP